jgi:CO/xanthine dehydrogenase Mo-binding subunit
MTTTPDSTPAARHSPPTTHDSFRVVGHNVERVDGLEKVTGAAQYVADIRLPGMLEGRILRSPYPHARVVRVDTSRAAALPGVLAVVTGEDTPKRRWGAFQKDQYVLAVDKARYVGDEVAAVAAVDEATADEALSLIEVEYEELPAVFEPEEAMQPGAPLIHDDKPNNIALHFDVTRGDPEAAFAAADLVVEDSFSSRIQWHASMETIGAVAQYSPRGKLTVWLNTAPPFMARYRVSDALALKVSDVRIIQTAVGGAFGGKSVDDNLPAITGLLAMKTGQPVRIINSREDEFLASRPRPAMRFWVRMGFRRDGMLIAKHVRVIVDNGAYCAKGPAVGGVTAMRHDGMFLNENVRSELFVVHTNKIPTGAFRGFGNPEAALAVDQMFDVAAEHLGLDPLDVALKNMIDGNHTSPHGQIINSCELKACVSQAAELIGWKEKRANRVPNRGLGMASSIHVSGKRHFGDYDGSSATINVSTDGKVQIWSGEGETGPGATTVFAQIAAEELGVRYEDVTVSQADTDTATFTGGSYASRVTYIAGNAVREAARQVKEQMLQTAAEELEVAPEDLEIKDGVVSVKGAPGDARSLTVAEVAWKHLYRRGGRPLSALGVWDPPSTINDANRYGNESGAYNFCAHAVEVQVDPTTGNFQILKYVAASDAGTVVFPRGAEGQNEGGVAQGIGYAVTEELLFDNGRPVNPNFSDYRLACIKDMPPFEQVFVDSYEPTGPFGAKGIGEIGIDPTAPALANAIYDAVGVRIKTVPITPEKVLWGLREKEQAALTPTVSQRERRVLPLPLGEAGHRPSEGQASGSAREAAR